MTHISAVPYDYYLLKEGETQADLPRTGTYYIVARNGVFIHKGSLNPADIHQGLVESVTRVLGPPESNRFLRTLPGEEVDPPVILPGLIDCQTYANIKITPIPHLIAAKALAFFARVLKDLGGESEVQLYYSQQLEEFELVCPSQAVSRSGVTYDREANGILDTPRGRFLRAGTIHSHCDFAAFHSGTDTADEKYEDGIHITFGHVNAKSFSIVASVVANDHRFSMLPSDVIEGIQHTGDKTQTNAGTWFTTSSAHTEKFYTIEPFLTPNGSPDSLRESQVMNQVLEWLPNVRKQTFWAGNGKSKKRRKGGFLGSETGMGGGEHAID